MWSSQTPKVSQGGEAPEEEISSCENRGAECKEMVGQPNVMKYYDVDSEAVWDILDEMEILLKGDQLFIFQSLRKGVSRETIAEVFGITRHALKLRIQRIWKKLHDSCQSLQSIKDLDLENLFE